MRIAIGGARFVLCLGFVWLLSCQLTQRWTGEISGWLAVPTLLAAVGIWVALVRMLGIV